MEIINNDSQAQEENKDNNNILNDNINNNNLNEKTNIKNKQNQKKHFNVEKIIEKCKNLSNFNLINYMAKIMQESKSKYLKVVLMQLGKDYIIKCFERALNIENTGGLMMKNNKEKKTIGGVFFTIIKQDPEAKKILKTASKMSKKMSKSKK